MSHYKYENPFTKRYVSITAIEKFSNKSLEEMRFEYYLESLDNKAISEEKFNKSEHIIKVVSGDTLAEEANVLNKWPLRNDLYQISNDNVESMEVNCMRGALFSEPIEKNLDNDIANNILFRNKNISIMKENEKVKRCYFSETEDTQVLKKMRIDDNSDEKNVIHGNLKRDKSFNEKYDFLTTTIGKKVKVDTNNGEIMTNFRKTRRKNNIDYMAEDKRILALIDELRKQGNIFVKEKNYVNALDKYTNAISFSSKHSKIGSLCYSNRALCFQKMGRVLEALEDCIQAILLDEKNWKAQLRKIKCLIDLNRYTEAEKDALTFNNDWKIEEGRQLLDVITSAMRLSKLKESADKFVAAEQLNEALKCYNEAIEIDSGDAALFGKRASLLFLMTRYNESLADVDESLRLVADDESVCRTRIECLVKLERFHEASNDALRLQNLIPSKDNTRFFLWTTDMEKQAKNRNYYQILGVTSSASLSEIKKRYRKLTLLYHPDKLINCESEAKIIQEDKFKHLTKIYSVLSDPVSRRMYDIELRCRY